MKRDPLASLLRLRALDVATARRDMADRLAGATLADQRAAQAEAAIASELRGGSPEFADSLAAWLPLARAARDRTAGEARLAAQAVDAARQALADRRASERAVEIICETRAAAERAAALRRAQAALDEVAQRRR